MGNTGNIAFGNQFNQSGHNSRMNINNAVASSDVDAAVAELRAFVEHLSRTGAVAPDGTVTNPATVVAEVESNRSRMGALTKAVLGGAKDAVLSVVKGGVAALVVALLGG